jgi:hypothetical protein
MDSKNHPTRVYKTYLIPTKNQPSTQYQEEAIMLKSQ